MFKYCSKLYYYFLEGKRRKRNNYIPLYTINLNNPESTPLETRSYNNTRHDR